MSKKFNKIALMNSGTQEDDFLIYFSDGTEGTFSTPHKALSWKTIEKVSDSSDDTFKITFLNGEQTEIAVANATGIESMIESYITTYVESTIDAKIEEVFETEIEEAVEDAVEEIAPTLTAGKAPAIEVDASGAIVSFEDGADDLPLKSLSVAIEPVQDLHGYDNPWPAGATKNLAELEQGTINVSTGVEETSTTRVRTNFIPVTPNAKYTASSQNNGWRIKNGITYNASKEYIGYGVYPVDGSGGTVTIPDNNSIAYLRLIYAHATDTETAKPSDYWYQFEAGETATSYIPCSNICPITGHTQCNVTGTGVNLISLGGEYGYWIASDGTKSPNSVGYLAPVARVKPDTYYTLNGDASVAHSIIACWYDKSMNFISRGLAGASLWPHNALSPANAAYAICGVSLPSGQTISSDNIANTKAQVEEGHSASAYVPFGTTLTFSLGSTVYGAHIDVLAGELAVGRAIVDMGDLTWTAGTRSCFVSSDIASEVAGGNNIICDTYRKLPVTLNNSNIDNNNYFIRINKNASGTAESGSFVLGAIVVKDTLYADYSSFATAMSGHYLVYELATPSTTTLTPAQLSTLLGSNRIWADTGDVSLTYRADTKKYVDSQINIKVNDAKKLIAAVTDTMVAPSNLTAGDFIIVNDDLLKITANVSSGSALTLGTNCAKTTVAEALVALATA